MTCWLAKYDVDNDKHMQNILFSDADNRVDAIKEIIDYNNDIFKEHNIAEKHYRIETNGNTHKWMLQRPFPFTIIGQEEACILVKRTNILYITDDRIKGGHNVLQEAMNNQRLNDIAVDATITDKYYIIINQTKFYEYGLFDPNCLKCDGILISTADNREKAIDDLVEIYPKIWINTTLNDKVTSREHLKKQSGIHFLLDSETLSIAIGMGIGILTDMNKFKQIIDRQKQNNDVKDSVEENTIGEQTKESCSRCGRINNLDNLDAECPICKRLDDYEQLIIKLRFTIGLLSGGNDSFIAETVDNDIMKICKLDKQTYFMQLEKWKFKLLNACGIFSKIKVDGE